MNEFFRLLASAVVRIESRLAGIQTTQETFMSTLNDLRGSIAAQDTVIASALALIQGFSARLEAAGTDDSALAALKADIDAHTSALADAVAANTPAAGEIASPPAAASSSTAPATTASGDPAATSSGSASGTLDPSAKGVGSAIDQTSTDVANGSTNGDEDSSLDGVNTTSATTTVGVVAPDPAAASGVNSADVNPAAAPTMGTVYNTADKG